MPGPHDKGGEPEDWERIADAVNAAPGKRGIQTTDEHHRAIVSLPDYRDLSYHERWASATERLLIEKGILTEVDIDERADALIGVDVPRTPAAAQA